MPTTKPRTDAATHLAEADQLYLPPPPWWDTDLHRRELWRNRIRPAIAAVRLARTKRERARALLEAGEVVDECLAEEGGCDEHHRWLMLMHCSDLAGVGLPGT